MVYHRSRAGSVNVMRMMRGAQGQTKCWSKRYWQRRFIIASGLAPNIRELNLDVVFEKATHKVSLARLVRKLPDDVRILSIGTRFRGNALYNNMG